VSLLVLPGTYTVTLTVADEKFTQKLNVLKDPHSAGSENDIQAQTRVQTALFDEMNATAATVKPDRVAARAARCLGERAG